MTPRNAVLAGVRVNTKVTIITIFFKCYFAKLTDSRVARSVSRG